MSAARNLFHLEALVLQIREGDFVSVEKMDVSICVAILTRQILFGGHWCFVFYPGRSKLPLTSVDANNLGFNAFVDLIAPKCERRIAGISRGNQFSHLMGPELLNQAPLEGQTNFRIFRWKDKLRDEVEYLKFTPQPTAAERYSPHYGCFHADFAFDLSVRRWKVGTAKWV